jgi:hypothetical protein
MPRKTSLRAVAPDEKPAPKKATTVAAAVADGTRRDELVAMRTRIARAIDDPNIRGADLASLSRRLLEIGKELEALDTQADEEQRRDVGGNASEPFDSSAI